MINKGSSKSEANETTSPSSAGQGCSTVVSKNHPLKHYVWGTACDGWNLVENNSLSVKQERMPAGTSEELHYHQYAQQFFFILKGRAQFQIEDSTIVINTGEGLHIEAGKKHRILNTNHEDLEFILCSQPSTLNDRINCG
jgi:mannose-6-phosphate isomerase-like protein (cupin superfamily)